MVARNKGLLPVRVGNEMWVTVLEVLVEARHISVKKTTKHKW